MGVRTSRRSTPLPRRAAHGPRRFGARVRGSGDGAVTAITGFAIAVAVYAVAFLTFMSASQLPGQSTADGDAPLLRVKAESALAQVFDSPGWRSGSTEGADWENDPDALVRLGVALDGQPGVLDPAKLRNLTRGQREADPSNGLLDYEEARAALGLSDAHFHLRLHPVSDPAGLSPGAPIKHQEVAYVARQDPLYSPTPSNYPVQYSSRLEDRGDRVFVNVTITNNGTAATMFAATFQVPLADNTIEDVQLTAHLAPGESEVVGVTLYKQAAWLWAGAAEVDVVIHDPEKEVAAFSITLLGVTMTTPPFVGGSHAAVTVTPRLVPPHFYTYPSNTFAHLGYDVWDARGNLVPAPTVNITVRDVGTGDVEDQWEGSTEANDRRLCCKLPEGTYNVTIWSGAEGFNSTEVLTVTDDLIGEFLSGGGIIGWTASAASAYERGLLATLVDGWTNTTHASGGDVYPDRPDDLNDGLVANLTNGKYDVVVLGSEVNHTAMTGAGAPQELKEWVRRGGLLVVLGTGVQAGSSTFLGALTDADAAASALASRASDPGHPLLHTPEELGWQAFDDLGGTWRFGSGAAAADFYHVLQRGSSDDLNPLLTISNPGRFGNGSIVLTGLRPYALTTPQHDSEAVALLYNLLQVSLRPLYVELGPRVTEVNEAASASRLVTAEHPFVDGSRVLVRATLYVFR